MPTRHPPGLPGRVVASVLALGFLWLPAAANAQTKLVMSGKHRMYCCDTPPLNAFIREVRAVTLEIGGRWEKREPDSFGANYDDQWDETGIRL